MSKKKPSGWTQIRHQLNDCSKPDLIALLKDLCEDFYPRFQERIQHLTTHAKFIGWGYGDFLDEQVDILEQKLAGE